MEVICEHCKAKLNLPDEKIPKDQLVKISCPKCKNKITLDTRKSEEKKPPPAETEPKPAPEPGEENYSYDDYSDDEALDFFEEDAKLALVNVGDTDYSEKIKTTVEEIGYQYISSSDTRDATGKMRFHHFDLVILADGFDGQPLENSPLLNYLNHVSMSVRRRIFLTLVGDKFKTMDNMMAFAMSANTVINTKDMDKLSSILKKAILDNEKFYKVFMDAVIETGKA